MSPEDREPVMQAQVEEQDLGRRRLPLRIPRVGGEDESLAHRLALQWAQLREERQAQLAIPVVPAGPAARRGAEVPYGVDLAAAWSWRFLVISAALALIGWVLSFFFVVVMPVVVALLVTALISPMVNGLQRAGVRRTVGALIAVVTTLATIGALLTVAGQQVADGFDELARSVDRGLGQIVDWLRNGPLNASNSQINGYIDAAQRGLREYTQGGEVLGRVTEVGSAVTHVFAGFFIALFATYFFLADGERIWRWIGRIAPRAAREKVDASGRVAWISLTQFVRATVLVALVDAVFIAIGAAVLKVPFVLAIGVLVFLGAFVPMIGATIAGTIAVLVALVDQGLITALLMLAVIIVVQQVEGHVLQPFLMGRWVSLHPLAVILAIAAGVLVAGVGGALIAVPLAAAVNAVVLHLASAARHEPDPAPEEHAELEPGGAAEVQDERRREREGDA